MECPVPSEIRHIIFQEAEVARAVRAYRERTGTVVKSGDSYTCSLDGTGAGDEMRFSMTVGFGSHSQTLTAAGSELAAALILYCRGQRIPLPAGAAKSLQRFGSQLCLVGTSNSGGKHLPNMQAAG